MVRAFFCLYMKEIQLSKGKIAIVDDNCAIEILERNWHYHNRGYAGTNVIKNGKRGIILMHRVIMDAPKGVEVDHVNGNKLDNRKENLRLCTHAQNMQNKKIYKSNIQGFKGLTFIKGTGNIRARINKNGKEINLGMFATAEEAAKAYNEAAIKYFGEFANLNKID